MGSAAATDGYVAEGTITSEAASASVAYTNTRKTGTLTLTKTVSSELDSDKEATYTFTITLDADINATYGDVTFTNGVATVTLTGETHIAGVNATGGICGGSMQSVRNCCVDGTTIHVLGDNDFSDGRIIQQDVAECGGLIIGGSFGGTMDNCTAKGTVIAEGSEPVGLGGVAGCLEMMDSVTN